MKAKENKKEKPMSILKTIKGKPSIALEFMVKGLLKHSKRKDFKIDMSTFGFYDSLKKKCYGCCATCAVQEVAGKKLKGEEMSLRGMALNMNDYERGSFEMAIDQARRGDVKGLFYFCEKGNKFNEDTMNNRFSLENKNWKKELPKVRKLIRELKAKRL